MWLEYRSYVLILALSTIAAFVVQAAIRRTNRGLFRTFVLCLAGCFLGLFAGLLLAPILVGHSRALVSNIVSFLLATILGILFDDFADRIVGNSDGTDG